MGRISDALSRFTGGRGRSRNDGKQSLELAGLDPDLMVVGLGNPGAKYAVTRHNIGYLVIDELLESHDAGPLRPVAGVPATGATYKVGDRRVLVLRSDAFMNLSGEAVAAATGRLGLTRDQVLIVHDELDLEPGVLRLRSGGNENGHNGLKSASAELGGRDYLRLRVGIGRPEAGVGVVDHVLGALPTGPELDRTLTRAAQAVDLVATEGLQRAQNTVHQKR